jgi:hypothetical protein
MTGNGPIRFAFEPEPRTIAIDRLLSLKILRSGVKASKKYMQILGSVRAIGLVEAPVVAPDPKSPDRYFLLDGHLRVEALKDLGITEVECLISTDDEGYTYNKRINRLAPVQEHRMVRRAIERGVPEARIAEALGLEIATIYRRARMLNGICPDAVEILKDLPCPMAVFDILRRMAAPRQIVAAELMVGQNNFSVVFARALLAATHEKLLVKQRSKAQEAVSSEQIARMEHELATLQTQVKSFEESYGIDNLHLTVARGYVRSLLANARIVRWITQHREEYLAELQAIAEIDTVVPIAQAAE